MKPTVAATIEKYLTESVKHSDPKAVVASLSELEEEHKFTTRIYGSELNFTGEEREVLDVTAVEMTQFEGIEGRRLEFAPGVTLIYGPNNVGKSTALRAMRYALGGRRAAGVKDDLHLVRRGADRMWTRLEFARGRIERRVDVKRVTRGARAGEVQVTRGLSVEIEGDKSEELEKGAAIIDHWLGVDLDFILRSNFLQQEDLASIISDDPAKRREWFYRLLALTACEETRGRLSTIVSAMEEKVGIGAQQAEELEQKLVAAKKERSRIPRDLLVQQLKDLEAKLSADGPALALALAGAQKELAEARALAAQLGQHVTDRKRMLDLKATMTTREELCRALPEIEQQHAAARAMVEALSSKNAVLLARCEELVTQGKTLMALPAKCGTCAAVGKDCDITPEMKQERRRELLEQFHAANGDREQVQRELHDVRKRLADLDRTLADSKKEQELKKYFEAQLKICEEQLAKIPEVSLEQHRGAEQKVQQLQARLAELEKTKLPDDDRELMRQQIAEADRLDVRVEELGDQLAKAKKASSCDRLLEHARLLKATFAKDALPLWLAAQHVDEINKIAAETAGADGFGYRFTPELAIEFYDGAGTIAPEVACGSSRQRGGVVLAAAAGRYMHRLARLRVPTLVIDEIAYQDAASTEAVIAMLKQLQVWFPKIILTASNWEPYLGQFDHEIALSPESEAKKLDEARARSAKKGGKRAPAKAPPAEAPKTTAPVKTYKQLKLCVKHYQDRKEPAVVGEPEECAVCLAPATEAPALPGELSGQAALPATTPPAAKKAEVEKVEIARTDPF